MSRIYQEAVKLLRRRDYTVQQLRERLQARFGEAPDDVLNELISKKFINDRRFAENVVAKRTGCHPARVREELRGAGVDGETIEKVMAEFNELSLQDALKTKMADWHLSAPLERREAARLFRALSRLGYPEEEIREELEQLHEQQ